MIPAEDARTIHHASIVREIIRIGATIPVGDGGGFTIPKSRQDQIECRQGTVAQIDCPDPDQVAVAVCSLLNLALRAAGRA